MAVMKCIYSILQTERKHEFINGILFNKQQQARWRNIIEIVPICRELADLTLKLSLSGLVVILFVQRVCRSHCIGQFSLDTTFQLRKTIQTIHRSQMKRKEQS